MITSISYPRAALFGNPSDGFFGKTIAFPFQDFHAEVTLSPRSKGIRLQGGDLYSDLEGFYQMIQQQRDSTKTLLQATLKRFLDYCSDNAIKLPDAGFEIDFHSNIPLQVGMAGSSAIITAAWRVLLKYYNLELPPHLLANQVLEVETLEMGIGAGLQDRVVQAFERPIFMDFRKDLMETQGFGSYKPIPKAYFQNLYIAYMDGAPEGSEVIHNDLRSRYDEGETAVHQVMKELSTLTESAKELLEKEDGRLGLANLINKNFDLRQSICEIAPAYLRMIQMARDLGASAKFTGSGGTIIGQYTSGEMYKLLEKEFSKHHMHIFKPTLVSNQ